VKIKNGQVKINSMRLEKSCKNLNPVRYIESPIPIKRYRASAHNNFLQPFTQKEKVIRTTTITTGRA
jgi:hypothetical protein